MSPIKLIPLYLLVLAWPPVSVADEGTEPDLTAEDLYMRSTFELAADRLYQREKYVFLSTIAFIDEAGEFSDLPSEELRKKKEQMTLFAAQSIFPIIESFPSEVSKTVVLPQYVSALDAIGRKHDVEILEDIPVDSKEAQIIAFFLLQEAVNYSSYLLHENPAVIAEYRNRLSETIVRLRREQISCADISDLEGLAPIRDALTNTVDIDRTEGVVVMIEEIFSYLSRVEDDLNCGGESDDL